MAEGLDQVMRDRPAPAQMSEAETVVAVDQKPRRRIHGRIGFCGVIP